MQGISGAYLARKRPRLLEDDQASITSTADSESSANILTRSPDYWFEDGSIILQAESTQFRVHKSLLARHSAVFKDMFEVPRPADGEPLVEGCLVVHLSVTAEDVEHMICSLYDRCVCC